MLQPLIVGFGKAGKNLHLHCLRKVRRLCMNENLLGETVGVVDPKLRCTDLGHNDSVRGFQDLVDVQGFDPASTVAHVCTPPSDHPVSIRQLAELGYTRIIVEKPLAASMSGAEEISQLQEQWHLDLLVVAVWLSSALTKRLKQLLASKKFGAPVQLTIEQCKPRFLRTMLDSGHTTAFDVELPHQVALALHLGGQRVQVLDAGYSDMHIGTTVVPFMGTARMTLRHSTGLISYLLSDLTARTRKRSVTLSFENHLVEGSFPASRRTSSSELTVYDRSQRVLEFGMLEDDPLTEFFQECYRYYAGSGDRPASDLAFNMRVVSSIGEAKLLSGIPPLE